VWRQAVIEGVMMQTLEWLTAVFRKRNGDLKIKQERLFSDVKRITLPGSLFLRGVVALVAAFIKGMKTLLYSVRQCIEDEAVEAQESIEKPLGQVSVLRR